MINKDIAAGLVLAGAGILVTQQVQTLSYLDEFGPGPGFLPLWLGALMTVLASLLVFIGLRRREEVSKPEPATGVTESPVPRPRRALLAALGLIAMAAALEVLGFIVSLALASFFLVYVIERRSLLGAITVTIAITLSFLLIFRAILAIPLPVGPFGF
jgi:putative tricarboxylic transport membrane protein